MSGCNCAVCRKPELKHRPTEYHWFGFMDSGEPTTGIEPRDYITTRDDIRGLLAAYVKEAWILDANGHIVRHMTKADA